MRSSGPLPGLPCLPFVYPHLDYPFVPARGAPIQSCRVSGQSLINALCCELTVTARKRDATLRMSFRGGSLRDQELLKVRSEGTGDTISGAVASRFLKCAVDTQELQRWLLGSSGGQPVFEAVLQRSGLAHAFERGRLGS